MLQRQSKDITPAQQAELKLFFNLLAQGLDDTGKGDELALEHIFGNSDSFQKTQVINVAWANFNEMVLDKELEETLGREHAIKSVANEQIAIVKAQLKRDLSPSDEKQVQPSSTPSVTSHTHYRSSYVSVSSSASQASVSASSTSSVTTKTPLLTAGKYQLKNFQGSTEVDRLSAILVGSRTPVWKHEDSTVHIETVGDMSELTFHAIPAKQGNPSLGVSNPYQFKLHVQEENGSLTIKKVESVSVQMMKGSFNNKSLENQKIPVSIAPDEKQPNKLNFKTTIVLKELNISSTYQSIFKFFANPIVLQGDIVTEESRTPQSTSSKPK